MTMHRMTFSFTIALAALSSFALLQGCDKGGATPTSAAHDHDHGDDGHDHDHGKGDDHGHGATVELGTQKSGAFEIRAARDGDVKQGSDAAFDAWVTGGAVNAVRFWVGTEDAKGSIKAKAELEKDHWHTHVEVPATLPEGSKLWIEVENDKGESTLVSFDLKLH